MESGNTIIARASSLHHTLLLMTLLRQAASIKLSDELYIPHAHENYTQHSADSVRSVHETMTIQAISLPVHVVTNDTAVFLQQSRHD